MKPFLLLATAAVCFAATVPLSAIQLVESSINDRFRPHGTDPWDLLGNARGTYLEGYGAVFSFEIDLVNAGGLVISPFRPSISPDEIAAVRARKLKKLPELKDTMRSILVDAGNSLDGIPLQERIALEATLFSYSSEKNGKEMPRRILMSAERQKLLAARTNHLAPADLASIIDEQDQ